ncbi:MAG: tRNA (adenosine(37)-N6)-threonylcarbamoyltransferase complex dimerization subunit type 1 TsaB, partial [Clostridia bacterium]|nr:tRNA (adenosine(37)-N6)-threonylcarbamoyltransferase complex dimerization subunit type 1 TsaB [Clostridia bacterium]
AGVDKKEIKKVYVAIGPGSYTGVRIAMTIAKTVAVALNAEVYPISSLQILQAKDKKSICLMDARSARSYFAVYENEKVIECDQIKTNEEVKEYIASHPDYVVCGTSKQLGIEVETLTNDVIENMHRLRDSFEKIDNPLSLKPVYMKG